MNIKYCQPALLENIGDLSIFAEFINQQVDDDTTHHVIMRNRNGYDAHPGIPDPTKVEYTNLFEDLQRTLGIAPIIEDVLFWKCPKQSDLTNSHDRIHKDGIHGFPIDRKYAIVIPITTCDKIKISWYEDKDPAKTKYLDTQVIVAADPEDLIKVHECYLTKPMIVRIDGWHNISTESTEPSYFMSIRFDLTVDVVNKFVVGSP